MMEEGFLDYGLRVIIGHNQSHTAGTGRLELLLRLQRQASRACWDQLAIGADFDLDGCAVRLLGFKRVLVASVVYCHCRWSTFLPVTKKEGIGDKIRPLLLPRGGFGIPRNRHVFLSKSIRGFFSSSR